MSHRRYNPLLDEWVLCSPGRLKRPWKGQVDAPQNAEPPPHDPECYMCPGNQRAEGQRNPRYENIFLFDNDFPALSDDDNEPPRHPLLLSEPAGGRCRVLCFSPRHDRHIGSLSQDAVRLVVDAWAAETERLHKDDGAAYVQVFENRGAMMGASNPHPHGQIWGVDHVPTLPLRKARHQERYRESNGEDLLGAYIEEELRRSERVVDASEHWVQLVPYWAVWPFETMLVPRRRAGSLSELDDAEREALSGLLGRLSRRYDGLFGAPFPYSMGWYQRPRDGEPREGSRLHAVYLPPLVRSATVRKFLVGYELTSEPQRDFTPEEAAERLRAVGT